MAFKPFSIPKTLNTEGRRLAYLNAVLEDGDMAELKRVLAYIAESKGIKDIDLSTFEGDTLEFMRVLKKLGFGLHSLEIPKSHTA
ncbi:hypothetical protein NHP200010_04240 [Helicobacter bizzozeronii]|uniref:helix-turn-helix domain-containing transcriptional regulator n=1 Tax=Helicobacter bizzozeronii TaxID=56877 RepID=UPI00244D8F5D|nr:hypothetical protein [Helicobacter bizzozeronii]GMB92713.1 hypothetical protein NHP200010_04240 [Helicobacter bizzozeronii]